MSLLNIKPNYQVINESDKPFGFIKCHRSYLINPSKVDSFDTNRNEIHIDDSVIPVSRNNKADVIESLDIVKRNRK